MTTLTSATGRVAAIRPRVEVPKTTWFAVLCSRLLIVGAAAAGALFAQSHARSAAYDPAGFSRHLGSVGNVLAASTDRWDAIHYLGIAAHGYTNAVDTTFFPLYPLLIHVVGWLTRSDVAAGVLISAIAFVVALELLYRLALEELGAEVANATVLLLAFAPLSFFFTAVYTESLFLALSVGTFYLARHGRLGPASLIASAATLTHIEGILLIVPLAFCWWQQQGNPRRLRELVDWRAASLLLPVLALGGLCAYLHSRGFGWLAPISNETNSSWHHHFVGPVIGVALAIEAAATGLWQAIHGARSLQSLADLIILAICLAALIQAWKRLPRMYALYCGLYLVVLTSSPLQRIPLQSFDRYALMLFPLWIAAAAWIRERGVLRLVLITGLAFLAVYSFQFGRWLFVA